MQLDAYCALCGGLSWAALLLLCAPLSRLPESWGGARRALYGLLLAAAACVPLALLLERVRVDSTAWPVLLACAPLGLNALLAPLNSAALGAVWRRAPLIADLLAPLAVWAEFARGRRWFVLLKPLSLTLPLLLPLLALSLFPFPAESLPRVSPQARQIIADAGLYQSALDPQTSTLWVTDDKHTLYLVPLADPAAVRSLQVDSPQFQYAGLDPAQRRAYHLPPFGRELLQLNMDDPRRVERTPLRFELDKTQVFPTRSQGRLSLAISSESNGALLMLPDGTVPARNYDLGTTAYAAWDERRGRLYVAPHERSALLALDGSTMQVVARLECPRQSGHMTLDADDATLWTCFPWQGSVRPVNLETFEFAGRASVSPGVRVLALDERRGLLFCGGFTPYLDVLTLDGLQRVGRFILPGWERDMYADAERARLYVTTRNAGLWQVDYSELGEAEAGGPLASAALELVRLAARLALAAHPRALGL